MLGLTALSYNNIIVSMLPSHVSIAGAPWPVLPPGVHPATLAEIAQQHACNARRRQLFQGLRNASANLVQAGCISLYLDGSFVTDKPIPDDFDACWDPNGVSPRRLDPVLFQLANQRAAQKTKFGGEFFPSTTRADAHGRNYLEFFQVKKFTGQSKGIVLINLSHDPMLQPQVTP